MWAVFGDEDFSNKNKGLAGGGRGIRTLDTVARIHAFQACAFSHSATPPHRGSLRRAQYIRDGFGHKRRAQTGRGPDLQYYAMLPQFLLPATGAAQAPAHTFALIVREPPARPSSARVSFASRPKKQNGRTRGPAVRRKRDARFGKSLGGDPIDDHVVAHLLRLLGLLFLLGR
jgi:hypothetical protein